MSEPGQEVMAPSLSHATLLRMGLEAFAVRAVRVLVIVLAFTLFGAAVWWPDWRRLAAAAGFAMLVALPVWFKREPGRRADDA